MRYNYFFMILLLLAALIAPFFIKGPTGEPIMTVSDFVPETPEILVSNSTEVYRWQDEHGNWQFGDDKNKPAQQAAEQVVIEENITRIETNWSDELNKIHPESAETASGGNGNFSLMDAYKGTAMQQAKEAAGLMEERNKVLDDLMANPTP